MRGNAEVDDEPDQLWVLAALGVARGVALAGLLDDVVDRGGQLAAKIEAGAEDECVGLVANLDARDGSEPRTTAWFHPQTLPSGGT